MDKTDFYIYQSIFNEMPFFEETNYSKTNFNFDSFYNELALYIEKKEEIFSKIPTCYRCETEVKNEIKKQWFLDIKNLVERIKLSNVNFIPFSILGEINSMKEKFTFWCISRQLKFGHKIPNYCQICNNFVDTNFHCEEEIIEEVFDAWFISSLCSVYHKRMTDIVSIRQTVINKTHIYNLFLDI